MKKSLLESRDVARDPRIDPNAFFIEIDKIGCRKLDRNDVTRRIVIRENSRGSIRSYQDLLVFIYFVQFSFESISTVASSTISR